MGRVPQFSPNVFQIGVGVGIISLSAFFIGLILAFSFRIQADPVPPQFHLPGVLWLSTSLLALSSGMLEAAKYSLRRAAVSRYRLRLTVCLLFGFGFLILQLMSAENLIRQGVRTDANPHGSAFYVFMGIHAAHLLIGFVWLIYLFVRSRQLSATVENHLRKHRAVLSVAALYWHFMGIVWVILFYFLLLWTRG